MSENRPTGDDVMERVRGLVDQGNTRRVILKTSDGRQFAEFSLTTAVIGGVVMFFLPMAWLIILFGVIFAIVAKIRIEIVREISSQDDVLEMQSDDDIV